MAGDSINDEIDQVAARIAASSGVSKAVARRIVEDVIAQYSETVSAYVARRHQELTRSGWKNPDIYRRLVDEVAARPFAQPPYTERQIRRMIYG